MLGPDTTVGQAFRSVVAERAHQEALVCGAVRLTYGELLHRVEALAGVLAAHGIAKGDRIVCILPPGPEFASLFFAVADRGAVLTPVSPQIRSRQLGEVLQDIEPAIIIAARPLDADTARQALSLGSAVYASESPLSGSLMPDVGLGTASPVTAGKGVSPDDLLALVYTSGTAGGPKATMHTQRSLLAPVIASVKLRELWVRRPDLKQVGQITRAVVQYGERLLRAAGRPATFLSTVGWHTMTGLQVMLQALLMGDRLVVMRRFQPRDALRIVDRERVTVLVAVPMAFRAMLSLEAFEMYDTTSLLICGTGAAPCPPDLAREIQQRFRCALHIGFGATETAGGISVTNLADSQERQAETVGKPMPGVEIRIVDEQRQEVPRGQVGEVACRSDGLMLGYYGAPELSAAVIDSKGWYYSGDLAVLDETGYLRIVGRKRDVVLRGGQIVYPPEIEGYLSAHPKIREAAVVGVPAPLAGQSVWAFVILRPGAEMTAREVKDYCRLELEAFKIPSRIRFVSEFPRSETGKPQKRRLQETALEEMKGEQPS